MNTKSSRSPTAPQRISGPGELLQAVPYLLGFHPHDSLVLVGLELGALVVTARLDLPDAAEPGVVLETVRAMRVGGTTEVVAAVYADVGTGSRAAPLPRPDLARAVTDDIDAAGCILIDILLVAGGRWWSFTCEEPGCCPTEGRPVPDAPSAFTTAATVAGVVALPDRDSLAAALEPRSEDERAGLAPFLAAAENASVAAILDCLSARHERSLKRAIFSAARDSDAPRWSGLPDAVVARFVVGLGAIAIRDAVWMAVDDGRLDGRALWRDLAGRAPAPYDASSLFLFGWATWRAGDGALAGIAAERAVRSDPGYSAADLLMAALSRGVDPRQLPKLRLPRSA